MLRHGLVIDAHHSLSQHRTASTLQHHYAMNIIIFGPPGAGKGTQAELIIEKYSLPHLSTGNLFRAAIKNETPLGIKIKDLMAAGELVPDQVTVDLVAEELEDSNYDAGCVFDGFPRTVYQAEELDKLLMAKDRKVDAIISLEVPEEELVSRILSRGQGRSDDTEEGIKNRLEVYNSQTAPVLDYYKAHGQVFEINGVGSIDDIFGRISEVLD